MKWLSRLVGFGADAALSSGFGFLVVLVATRITSVSDFGSFALVLAIAAAQCQLAALGFGPLIYGRAASRPNGSSFLLGSAIVVTSVSGVAFYASTIVVFVLVAGEALALIYAAAGLRVLGAVGFVVVQDPMSRLALREFLPLRVLTVGAATALLMFSYMRDWSIVCVAAIWGLESLSFAFLACTGFAMKRAKISINQRYRLYLRKASPIALQALLIVIYLRFDQVYISFRFGSEALGLYAVAARLAELGNLAFNVLTLLITPLIINRLREERRMGYAPPLFMVGLGLFTGGICLTSFFVGRDALALIFGAIYSNSYMTLTIYLGSICFVAYGSIASRILAAQGITSSQAWSGVVGVVSNIILSVWLGEVIGMEGVALATVISYALAVLVLWIAVFRTYQAR